MAKYITYTREMARAYREGRKKMTRRIMKGHPNPYGNLGDQLIFGTTWATLKNYDGLKPTELGYGAPIWSYFDSDEKPEGYGKLRPARFLPGFLRDRMPRETLTIVRAERVQDITDSEAILEGIFETPGEPGAYSGFDPSLREYYATRRHAFRELWNWINLKRGYGWDKNPYTWVLGWGE